jgi:hypothetical protein
MPRFSKDCAFPFSLFSPSMDVVVSLGYPSSGLNKVKAEERVRKVHSQTVVGVFVRIRELVRRVETKGRRFPSCNSLAKKKNGWTLDPC